MEAPYPEKLVHRNKTNILVRSKSELEVANILTDLGISYEYEKPLQLASNDFRLSDFTIRYQGKIFCGEYLGMLSLPSYREDWMRKKSRYEAHSLRGATRMNRRVILWHTGYHRCSQCIWFRLNLLMGKNK